MTNELIDVKELKQKLRRIVNERGHEYVYEYVTYEDEYGEAQEASDCHYTTPHGYPSCIVGVLLAEVAPEELAHINHEEWKGGEPNAVAVYGLIKWGVDLGAYFTEEAIQALIRVQLSQDTGSSWGDAVDTISA